MGAGDSAGLRVTVGVDRRGLSLPPPAKALFAPAAAPVELLLIEPVCSTSRLAYSPPVCGEGTKKVTATWAQSARCTRIHQDFEDLFVHVGAGEEPAHQPQLLFLHRVCDARYGHNGSGHAVAPAETRNGHLNPVPCVVEVGNLLPDVSPDSPLAGNVRG